MAYRSGDNVTKLRYAQWIAASLSYLILQQQDSVGLVIYDDAVRRYLKPAGQTSQLNEVLHLLDVTPAREKSDLGLVFNDLAERFKTRGVVVIISDLFDDPARIVTGLKHLRHRRHEVIVFHVLDPAELDFPFRDTTLFKGMEGMADILTRSARLRSIYQAEMGPVVLGGARKKAAGWILTSTMFPCVPIRAWISRCRVIWRRDRLESAD